MPEANDLTVGIMALVAQQKREAISRRTWEALAAARARGTRLGNPNGAEALRLAGHNGEALRTAVQRNAKEHAQALAPVVNRLRSNGTTTLRGIAQALNELGLATRRGGCWYVSNVRNLITQVARNEN